MFLYGTVLLPFVCSTLLKFFCHAWLMCCGAVGRFLWRDPVRYVSCGLSLPLLASSRLGQNTYTGTLAPRFCDCSTSTTRTTTRFTTLPTSLAGLTLHSCSRAALRGASSGNRSICRYGDLLSSEWVWWCGGKAGGYRRQPMYSPTPQFGDKLSSRGCQPQWCQVPYPQLLLRHQYLSE